MEELQKVSNSVAEINTYKIAGLKKIVEQLQSCNYENEAGCLKNNVAFIALEEMSEDIYETYVDNFDIFEDRVKLLLARGRKLYDAYADNPSEREAIIRRRIMICLSEIIDDYTKS